MEHVACAGVGAEWGEVEWSGVDERVEATPMKGVRK